jgi:hypothetical protein
MSEHTSLKLLTSCGRQGYRSRCQDVVAALQVNGVRTARSGHAVAAPGSSGREDHEQDRQDSPAVDHHKACDAYTVVRDAIRGQRRCAAEHVDRQSRHDADLPRSTHHLRRLVCDWLSARTQASPQDRDHHSPHPDSPSSEVSDPLTHLTLQKLLTRCGVTRNVLCVRHATRKGSER